MYKIVTLSELKELIDFNVPLMYDSETINLYGRIRLSQFYQKGWDNALIVEYPNPFELTTILNKAHVVGFNIHYDISTIQDQLGGLCWQPANFDCCFLLSRLFYYKEEKFSLDSVISYIIGSSPYVNKKDMQDSNWAAPVLSEEQLEYAAMDVIYLQQVYDAVVKQKDDINYKLDLLATKYCLEFQTNGLPIDLSKAHIAYKANMDKLKEYGLTINCNSYKQVRDYIGSTLSDDLGLAKLIQQGNERAKIVRSVRKITKNNSYISKFIETARDDKLFGKFKISARSGRSTSNDQNLQQLPRSLKGLFGVLEDGDTVLIYSDFAQIQLRAACVLTGDKTMEGLFRLKQDLHNYVTEMIFGANFTDEQRQICKTANFSLLFGSGVARFKDGLLQNAGLYLSDEEACKIKSKWGKLWREIKGWQEKGLNDWRDKKAWETPLGRRYTAKMFTDQLAMQIQGFEAEVAKLTLHYTLPELKKLDPEIKLCNFIHDGFIYTCPNNKELYTAASDLIAEKMKLGWSEMCKSVLITDLDMPTKVRVGFNWGDIEHGIFIHETIK